MIYMALQQSVPQTPAEYEVAFERLLVEIKSIKDSMASVGRMHSDRSDIDLLEAETKTIRDETRTLLVDIDATQAQWEQRRDSDTAARDQENIALQGENNRLRSVYGLPPYGGSRLF